MKTRIQVLMVLWIWVRSVWSDYSTDVPAATMTSGVDLIVSGLIGAVVALIAVAVLLLGFAWRRTHLGGDE